MYYLLLFTPSDTLAEEITALLSLYLGDKLYVEMPVLFRALQRFFPKVLPPPFCWMSAPAPIRTHIPGFGYCPPSILTFPHWFMMAAQTCGSWYFPSYTTRHFFL